MIRSNLRLKALGLSAMLFGLMAFSASGAQAAQWMLSGNNVSSALLPAITITEIENKSASLLTEIGGAKVTFLCTAAELTGAKLEAAGKLTEGGKVKFTGCVTLLNGSPSAVCTPKTAGQPAGTILSNEGKGQLVLHVTETANEGLTRIEPVTAGGNFAVMEFGEECSLPELVPVKGVLYIKDCKGEGEVELVEHLIEQGPLTHLFVISDTPEHAANIDGSAFAALAGAHAGMKFSGLKE